MAKNKKYVTTAPGNVIPFARDVAIVNGNGSKEGKPRQTRNDCREDAFHRIRSLPNHSGSFSHGRMTATEINNLGYDFFWFLGGDKVTNLMCQGSFPESRVQMPIWLDSEVPT